LRARIGAALVEELSELLVTTREDMLTEEGYSAGNANVGGSEADVSIASESFGRVAVRR